MKRTILAAVSSLSLAFAAAPLAAQAVDSEEPTAEEFAAIGNMFGDIFGTADPLTAEQEARVPAAKSVVLKLFPEGTYARMMDESMAPMMESIMGEMAGTPPIAVGKLTGLSPLDLAETDEDALGKALALLDPNAGARNEAMGKVTLGLVTSIMDDIEPAYRAGLARAYAVRFTEAELADLEAYFTTPVGSKYAAESFIIFADPQVMSAMNEMMPMLMEQMPQMMGSISEVMEQYPEGRQFSDLDDGEKEQLSALLGVSLDDLAVSEPERYDEEDWGDEGTADDAVVETAG